MQDVNSAVDAAAGWSVTLSPCTPWRSQPYGRGGPHAVDHLHTGNKTLQSHHYRPRARREPLAPRDASRPLLSQIVIGRLNRPHSRRLPDPPDLGQQLPFDSQPPLLCGHGGVLSKVLSAVALVPAVFAAALPGREVARPHNEPVQFDIQQNYAQATFSVPFGQAHTDQDDESLVLNFTAHAHDEACGSSNITINGVPLPQEWEGDYASGSGSYQYTDFHQNELQRDLALAWNSTCLHGTAEADEAQVLTVNIKSIDGVPINTPSGFTISFKQNASPPALLRLETVPDPAPELSDIWRDPPAHLRLVFGTEVNKTGSLEDEIRELRALQAELALIQKAVAAKKQHINAHIRKEAKCLTEELKHCDGISHGPP
ncbi:hypothetical protein OPT61_g9361 [Boeremia exigua]|uniref:Uncharacterized protein n=1 Tax=Boeremia exigua TaxID=749465 RepID=A0ACC2HUQ2_9PLEO|nr:hypothetical protein OPT61_g9361 [Boeremia exigua]